MKLGELTGPLWSLLDRTSGAGVYFRIPEIVREFLGAPGTTREATRSNDDPLTTEREMGSGGQGNQAGNEGNGDKKEGRLGLFGSKG